ncbi:hypothetical protein [Methanolobus halotolerans]|uniref:Uncharacterized protein n=1 Tax=Methanolobus halotolerans TaxID=2052935 RepID=A0A4E0PVJ4_9EURY|nr:hypothetical protein [Methanolobus halotolerans]TGC08124.1 hypothetical protein CUN85_09890 [Methanolobus halotolerans]
MMIHDIGLFHTCNITSRIQSGQDEFGSPIYTTTSKVSSCRFIQNNGRIVSLDSGEHVVTETSVILPPTVTVAEGQTITSNVPSFSNTYDVTAVKAIFWPMANVVHHYECELKAVE